MDRFIMDLVKEYHVFVVNAFIIAGYMIAFLCVTGAIRFGIAVYRRRKGTYPPAASQMENH